MGAIMVLKALAVGFLVGFSVVGLSKAAIAALPAPQSAHAITHSAQAAHANLDRRVSPITTGMWRFVDTAFGARAAPRLQ